MAKIPDSLDTGLTAEEVLEAFDNALNNYPGTKSEVEEARGEYDNLGERLDEMSSDTPSPSTAAPAMNGTAAAGTSTDYARADHVHPSDTSKQDALTAAQLAAVNSGIDSAKVAQIAANTSDITLLRTFMAYVGYAEVTEVSKHDDEGRLNIVTNGYYAGSDTVNCTGMLAANNLPLDTDLTVENCQADARGNAHGVTGYIKDRGEGLGATIKPYIEIDNVRHYGVQQRYFYNDL